MTEPKRFCTTCGSALKASTRFCLECGTAVEATPAEEVAEEPAAATPPPSPAPTSSRLRGSGLKDARPPASSPANGADVPPPIVTVEDLAGQPAAGDPGISEPAPTIESPHDVTTEPLPRVDVADDAAPPSGKVRAGRREARVRRDPRTKKLRAAGIVLLVLGLLCLGVFAGVGLNKKFGEAPQPLVVNVADQAATAAGGAPSPGGTELAGVAPVDMPDVVGLDENAAREALADAGIDGADVHVQEQPFVGPVGRIIQQTPTRHTSNPGAVRLVKSAPATMPDVAGQQGDDATKVLEALGVRVVRKEIYSPGKVKGEVLDTDTKAGEALGEKLGRQVVLSIASPAQELFLDQLKATDSDCSTISNGSSSSGSSSMKVNGQSVDHGVSCSVYYSSSSSSSSGGETADYDLSRAVDVFTVTIGLSDATGIGTRVRFEILADGRLVAGDEVGFGESKDLSATVSGHLRLTLRVYAVSSTSSSSSSSVTAVWVKPTLAGSPDVITALAAQKP